MEKSSGVVLVLVVLLAAPLQAVSQSDFACHVSTDCHGAIVQSPPGRGECCAGRGLSFRPTQMDDCHNCFTEEEFVGPGSEFFVAFLSNIAKHLRIGPKIRLRISNLEERSQNIMVTSRLSENNSTIDTLSFEEIVLDNNLRTDGIEDQDNAIFVQSMDQGQLSVTGLGDEFTSSDTFHVLPCVYLPSLYEYYAVSVERSAILETDDNETFIAPPLGNSVFVIVACEGNTSVTLTLTQTVTVQPGVVAEKGNSTTVVLGRAETLFVSSEDCLTGSHVVSNKPIALFSGHECGTIPASVGFCDHMVEQIPPTSTWGKEFYTVPIRGRTMDGYKVISSRDNNVLRGACSSINSATVLPSLEINVPTAGQAVDFNISSDQFCHFESDSPVLLVQFSFGRELDGSTNADPFMAIVPPTRQYQNSYMVDHFSGASDIGNETYYLNIVFLTDHEVERNDLRLDGEPLDPEMQWTEIKCRSNLMATCAYGIQLEMDDDDTVPLSHSNTDARFMAISYTFGFRTGRGTFSGMAQKPIALDVVTIDASEYRVPEGHEEANITLTRTGNMSGDIILSFQAHALPNAANPAIPEEDFLEVEIDVVFPAGTNSIVVSVPLTTDDIFPEEDKVFEVYLGASPGVFISPIAYVNITIENDDPPLPGPCNSSNPCQNAGTCNSSNSTHYTCACQPGFTGVICEQAMDPCLAYGPCDNQGTCETVSSTEYTCQCQPGFTGENCTDISDPCLVYQPCDNGACLMVSSTEYTCDCSTGYTGQNCTVNIDDCTVGICNNGICIDGIGTFECECNPGYIGALCATKINECKTANCNEGTCIDLINDFMCNCYPDYTGSDCSQTIDDCADSPCSALGSFSCEDGNLTFTCICAAGFTGLTCSEEVFGCVPDPCENGATCMNGTSGTFTCMCPPEFMGATCTLDALPCDPNPCANGGNCIEAGLDYTCDCAPGWTSVNCTEDIDECSSNPCENGGTCTNLPNAFECACPNGFTGFNCSEDLPFCVKSSCLNDGTCVEGVGLETSCECALGFIGKQCEVAICPTELEVPVYPGSSIAYNWTQTEAGNSQTQQCPDTCQDLINYPTGATVVRDCRPTEDGAEWQDANTTGCGFDSMTLQLCEASQLERDEEIAAVVVNITAEASTLDSSALTVFGNIIQDLTDAAIEQPEVRENYLKIIDNVLEADMDELLESQTKSNSSTKILQGLNRFVDLVPVDNQTGNITFTLNNFGLIALDTDLLNQTRVQAFSANLGPVTDAISSRDTISANQLLVTADPISNATGSLEIQDLNLCPLQNSSQRIAYSVFRTDALFLTPETGCTNFTVGSIILGVRASISQRCNITSVIVDLEQLEEVCSGMQLPLNQQPICSNYDEEDTEGVGRWSQDNCKRVRGSKGRTICDCSQLGHFGLLFDLNPGDSLSPLALAIISYIGAILSIICLLIVVLTYVISRSLRKKEHGKLLINMSVSLICLYVIFIIAGLVTSVEVLCGLVSALFQYFMLVFFGWTTAEAVNLYYKLVRVLGEPIEHYVLKATLIVWLAPILIVVISVGPGYGYYVNPYYCRATDWPFWFGLILPFCVIYIFNWVIFTIIMMNLLRRNKVTEVDIPSKVNTRMSKQNFFAAVGLSLLFGLGWGFGLTATSSNTKEVTFAFQVIFSLFVGSQGILIFLFHGLRSPDFCQVWQSILCLLQQKKYAVSSREQRKTNSSYNTATLSKTGSLPLHSGPMFHSNTENYYSDPLSGQDPLVSTKEDVTHFQEDVDEKTDLGMEEAEGQNQSVGETANVVINAGRATDIPETCGEEKAVPTLEDAEKEIPAKPLF